MKAETEQVLLHERCHRRLKLALAQHFNVGAWEIVKFATMLDKHWNCEIGRYYSSFFQK